jgi:hypothetical protein
VALRIAAGSVREAREVAPGAACQPYHRHIPTGGRHGGRYVERQLARASRTSYLLDGAADTCGDLHELIAPELVAARPDRRTEHGLGDRLGEGIERSLEYPCRQPAPTGVHDGELGLGADQYHRRAVGRPAAENDIVELGDGDITDLAVTCSTGIDSDHLDTMALIELDPWQIEERATPCIKFVEGHTEAMEITVGARRAPDVQVATRALGDRGRYDAAT